MTTTETLVRQAGFTAETYLDQAIKSINERLGNNYAEKHPELVGAFINVAAMDFLAMYTVQELGSRLDSLCTAISDK